MATTITLGVATASSVDASSYALGTFTPVVGDLIVLCVLSSGSGTQISASDDQSGSYSTIAGPQATSPDQAIIFIRTAKVASAVGHIITVSVTGGATGLIGVAVRVASTSNRLGLSALYEAVIGGSAGGTTPSLVFSNSALTQNSIIGFIGNKSNPANLTPPTSWTEDADTGAATPLAGAEVVHIVSGFTNSTITWGSTSATSYARLAVQLDVSSVQRGQAQAQIKGFPTRSAQAQADIKATSNGLGQATADILATSTTSAQANAYITRGTEIRAYKLTTDTISSGAGASVVTASISPTAGRVVLATIYSNFSSLPNIPTATGNGQTWTQVTTVLDGSSLRRLTMFRAFVVSPTSGAVTFSFGGQSQSTASYSIVEFERTKTGGVNGADAIVQTASNTANATNTGITATLAAFDLPVNATYGVVRNNGSTDIVHGTGFISAAVVPASSGPPINSAFNPANDTTVDWSWASNNNVSIAIAVELARIPIWGLSQAQADIKATSYGFAQTQADIQVTSRGLAQAQADINQTYRGLGQSQADIKSVTSRSAQTQADIKATIFKLGQANADILATSFGVSQAQADIKAVNNGFGQAQGYILLATNKSAQAQAAIDTGIYDAVDTFTRSVSGGWGTADTGGAWTPTDSTLSVDGSKAVITPTGAENLLAEILAQVTAKRGDYLKIRFKTSDPTPSSQSIDFYSVINSISGILGKIDITTGLFSVLIGASASSTFSITIDANTWYWVEIQHTIPLNSSPLVRGKIWKDGDTEPGWQVSRTAFLSPTAKVGSPSIRATVGLSNLEIQSFDDFAYHPIDWSEVGQAQASILAVNNGFGQANSDIKATSYGFAQTQADIKVTSFASSQSQADIKANGSGFAQSQADIRAISNGFGQSNADIKSVGYGFSQANADIKATSFGFGQAQSDIKSIGYGFGQANADILVTSFGLGQTQADIKVINNRFAQSQADIKATSNGFAQAQADIDTTLYGFAQSQADIKAVGYGFGQAQSDINTTYQGYGQAQGYISISDTFGYAQAQADILVTSQGYGQSQADIKHIYNGLGQSQSEIKVTSNGFGQAQGDVLATSVGLANAQGAIRQTYDAFGQSNAQIMGSEQSFGQAQGAIKSTSSANGNAQANIKATYTECGQAQARIKQTYQAFGQVNSYIILIVCGFAQAQATIRGNAFAQAQADILVATTVSGNAQSLIRTTVNTYGQAQARIITKYRGFGQAQAEIKATFTASGQAQALIVVVNINSFGQTQAFILKSAGYGQTQAFIFQPHYLKNLTVSDEHSTKVTMSDEATDFSVSDVRTLALQVSDSHSIKVTLSSEPTLSLTVSDVEY